MTSQAVYCRFSSMSTIYSVRGETLISAIFAGTAKTNTHPRDCWKRLLIYVDDGVISLATAEQWYSAHFGEAELQKRRYRPGNYAKYSATEVDETTKDKLRTLRSYRNLAKVSEVSPPVAAKLKELEAEVGHLLDTLPK